jgi:membrane-bound lytic murein transglycosylase D
VPLDQPDIKERFEREIYVNAYWQSNMILLMKRANKYLPSIEKTLKQQGIPDDFKYLAMAESGLMNVVSPAGARGFWQFMPATAKEYDLEVSDEVDERYHLEKSTVATCKYLKSAFAKFGNWTAVAASYNMGITGFGKRLQEQRQANYYDLLLNDETSRYLFRILAFKEIFENPVKYGFELRESELYQAPIFRDFVVESDIDNLATWAIKHNSNYKELKLHNPWLRSSKLKVKKGKSYSIQLPVSNL